MLLLFIKRWQWLIPTCLHWQLLVRGALKMFVAWNALGRSFLQHSDMVVEKLLFLVFQPAICRAVQTRMANTVGDRVVQSWHFGWQPVLELTCDQMRCPGSKWLLFFFLYWKNSWKDTKFSDDEDVICTVNGWLEDQEQQFFYNGIRALEKCWTKRISVAGVYVEKWQNMLCVSRG